MTTPFDRGYVLIAGVVAIVVLVVVLLLSDFGGELPALPRFVPPTTIGSFGPTDNRLGQLFAPAALAVVAPATNLPAPFVTAYFQPPPPPPPPPPDIKKTRKVTLTYNGFFETSSGEKRAYVLVGGASSLLTLGAPVVSDLMISNIQRTQLTLRRAITQEVTVPFRGSTEVEIPAE